jgi:hypothetical protein
MAEVPPKPGSAPGALPRAARPAETAQLAG